MTLFLWISKSRLINGLTRAILKKEYGAYYVGDYAGDYAVDASLPPDFKLEDTVYTGRKDNLLYRVNKIERDNKKSGHIG